MICRAMHSEEVGTAYVNKVLAKIRDNHVIHNYKLIKEKLPAEITNGQFNNQLSSHVKVHYGEKLIPHSF